MSQDPTATSDVAVIGGGVIGLAIAWRAAQRGLSACVLERGELGAGASRVAAGMLARVGLGDRGQHSGGDARRAGAELAALEHAHAQAPLRRAPGDGEADDAPADDGDVGRCGWVLRHWHLASPA